MQKSTLLLIMLSVHATHQLKIDSALIKYGMIQETGKLVSLTKDAIRFTIMVPLTPKEKLPTSGCGNGIFSQYISDVQDMLEPLKVINGLRSSIGTTKNADDRLVGVVMAIGAVGAIAGIGATAGVALSKAINNERNINELRAAMTNTNAAVEKVIGGVKSLAVIVKDVVNTINNDILPKLNELNCNIIEMQARSDLTDKVNYWITAVAPILESPLTESYSYILAAALIKQATTAGLSSTMSNDDMMKSAMLGLVSVSLTEYDPDSLSMLFSVAVKTDIPQNGQVPVFLHRIAIRIKGSDDVYEIEGPDASVMINNKHYKPGSTCKRLGLSLQCSGSSVSEYDNRWDNCMRGYVDSCTWKVPLIDSSYILLNQGILADCDRTSCMCRTNSTFYKGLTYMTKSCPNVIINSEEYLINGVDMGAFISNDTMQWEYPDIKNISTINPDAMQVVWDALEDAKEALDKSNAALARIETNNGETWWKFVVTGVVAVVAALIIDLIIACCCANEMQEKIRDLITVNRSTGRKGANNQAFENDVIDYTTTEI